MKRALYLDDCRIPMDIIPGYRPWSVVTNYKEFVKHITKHGLPDYISFDHDLADEHTTDFTIQTATEGCCVPNYDSYTEKTGLDCAKWLVEEYCQKKNLPLPLCSVHSQNPIGAKNIQSYLNGYSKHIGLPTLCFLGGPKFIITGE